MRPLSRSNFFHFHAVFGEKNCQTRQHYSRMRTACFPTVRVLMAITAVNTDGEGEEVGHQVNKFEKISSDEYQMSVLVEG